jgi:Flp pilus assembly pilin Flp
MIARMRLFLMRSEGQTMTEYGVFLAVIIVSTVGAYAAAFSGTRNMIRSVISAMTLW